MSHPDKRYRSEEISPTVLFYTEENKERAEPLYKADDSKDNKDEKSVEEKKA